MSISLRTYFFTGFQKPVKIDTYNNYVVKTKFDFFGKAVFWIWHPSTNLVLQVIGTAGEEHLWKGFIFFKLEPDQFCKSYKSKKQQKNLQTILDNILKRFLHALAQLLFTTNETELQSWLYFRILQHFSIGSIPYK